MQKNKVPRRVFSYDGGNVKGELAYFKPDGSIGYITIPNYFSRPKQTILGKGIMEKYARLQVIETSVEGMECFVVGDDVFFTDSPIQTYQEGIGRYYSPLALALLLTLMLKAEIEEGDCNVVVSAPPEMVEDVEENIKQAFKGVHEIQRRGGTPIRYNIRAVMVIPEGRGIYALATHDLTGKEKDIFNLGVASYQGLWTIFDSGGITLDITNYNEGEVIRTRSDTDRGISKMVIEPIEIYLGEILAERKIHIPNLAPHISQFLVEYLKNPKQNDTMLLRGQKIQLAKLIEELRFQFCESITPLIEMQLSKSDYVVAGGGGCTYWHPYLHERYRNAILFPDTKWKYPNYALNGIGALLCTLMD